VNTPHRDQKAADILETLGNLAVGMGPLLGPEGAAAGVGAKAIAHAAAELIRSRGLTVDDLVARLRHADQPHMPWEEP
jgi:hypothetical protein